MLKIQSEKFQEDGNQDGVYLLDEGKINVDVDGDAEVDAVVQASVFQDVNLDGGAGVVGDAKAGGYVGVDVDVDAHVELLVEEDADADAELLVEEHADAAVDVGVEVDVGLGVSVQSGVEVSMHFFLFFLYIRSPEG